MLSRSFCTRVIWALFLALIPGTTLAQASPFSGGWTLQSDASALNFQSVKNETKVESSGFATFSGAIDETGAATVSVLLDSVDTKIDLRNVRMRFLFFETFQFPQAVITAEIDPAQLDDLRDIRRKRVTLPYTLSLHGVTKASEAEVFVTLLTDDLISVSTSTPISVAVSDFGLETGVEKLEEAAGVKITPSATVTFDFVFARNSAIGIDAPAGTTGDATSPASAALETQGNFDLEACKGRFEILSRTGNIYFRTASARLDDKSTPLLNSVADIVARCPDLVIEVSGHTDSDGSDATNQQLSEARAQSVTSYLVAKGIEARRIFSVGYGESKPVAPNDTAANKSKNRRIEFAVAGE